MLRLPFSIVLFTTATTVAPAQLVDRTKIPLTLTVGIATKFSSVQTVDYRDEGPVHTDGSYMIRFVGNAQQQLSILFPHPRYWTAEARRQSKQPVIAILRSDGSQELAEVPLESKLNLLVLRLIKRNIADPKHDPKTITRLKYTLNTIEYRKRHRFFAPDPADTGTSD